MKWRSPSPVNSKIKLVRPLLGFSKTEILAFAGANRILFREDATNRSNDFLRNRVRNELLPLLRGHYQPGLTKTVLRLMEIVGAEAEIVGRLAGNWLKQRRPVFGKLPAAVQRRVLQMQLGRLNVAADFDLVEQLREPAGRFVSIGAGLSIARSPDGRLKLREQPLGAFNPDEFQLDLRGRAGKAEFGGAVLSWHFDTNKKDIPRHELAREFYDADKIGEKIILRHWRPGDRFHPIGLKAAVKLQDLFTNEKIPRDRRRDLLVAAAAGGEIFWVEGLRISEKFKLTPATRHRFIWQWRRCHQ
jgi:tRNA(Ile)-lysidine synthase